MAATPGLRCHRQPLFPVSDASLGPWFLGPVQVAQKLLEEQLVLVPSAMSEKVLMVSPSAGVCRLRLCRTGQTDKVDLVLSLARKKIRGLDLQNQTGTWIVGTGPGILHKCKGLNIW